MRRFFTSHLSDARIGSIFRAARFGDRTRCPRCGNARKLWRLEDGRWRCPRCRKRFGLLTDTWLSHTRFELPEIYELLFWFELEITDHGIARGRPVLLHADRREPSGATRPSRAPTKDQPREAQYHERETPGLGNVLVGQ